MYAACEDTGDSRHGSARGCVDAECTDGADLVCWGRPQPTGTSRCPVGVCAEAIDSLQPAPVAADPAEAPPPPGPYGCWRPGWFAASRTRLFPDHCAGECPYGRWIGEIKLLMVCDEQQTMTAATAYLEDVHAALERLVAAR